MYCMVRKIFWYVDCLWYISQGDEADCMYFVEDGKVVIKIQKVRYQDIQSSLLQTDTRVTVSLSWDYSVLVVDNIPIAFMCRTVQKNNWRSVTKETTLEVMITGVPLYVLPATIDAHVNVYEWMIGITRSWCFYCRAGAGDAQTTSSFGLRRRYHQMCKYVLRSSPWLF